MTPQHPEASADTPLLLAASDNPTRLQAFVDHEVFKRTITGLIFFNAFILGGLTFTEPGTRWHLWLSRIDFAILALFVIEISVKLLAWRGAFFKRGWNVFDFVIVGMSLVPISSSLAIMRAVRVLRILRLLHVVPMMRRITEALFRALPGMSAIIAVLMLVVYVSAVIATDMFGNTDDPDVAMLFGDLHSSALSLFQVMTMDGWRNEVVQKVMDDGHPYAWIFFMIFIFVASFAILNLFIALFVEALQAEHDIEQDHRIDELDDKADDAAEVRADIIVILKDIQEELAILKASMGNQARRDP